MRKLKTMLLPLCLLGLSYGCKDRCPDCPSYQICADEECVLRDDCFELNKVGVCYDNLYLGVAKGNSCLDTIIFNGTNTALGSPKAFIYFVKSRPVGLEHRTLSVSKELGENEYIMWDINPVCGNWLGGGVYWYFSNIRCKIYPDSVQMNIYFQATDRTLDDPFIDSCEVTLYKKAFLPN